MEERAGERRIPTGSWAGGSHLSHGQGFMPCMVVVSRCAPSELAAAMARATSGRGHSSLFPVESKCLVHQIVADNAPAIPKGLNHSAQGWPILRGLPWVAAFELHNPERVEYQSLRKQIQPLQGCDSSMISPRVARSSQPWAGRFNPVGIGKTNDEAEGVNPGKLNMGCTLGRT